jgi:uncharacterized membrane protein (UPF0136 family)
MGWLAVIAQGGNPGEGPGWFLFFAKVALVATAILGTILTAGLAVMQRGRPRKPPIGRAIIAAYVWSAILVVGAALAGLFSESWFVVGALVVVGGVLFWAVVHRLWRDY